MAALDALLPPMRKIAIVLRDFGVDPPELPNEGAASRAFAHWFAALNFALLMRENPGQPVPRKVVDTFEWFRGIFTDVVGMSPPSPRPNMNFFQLGALSLSASAGIGDNWCEDSHARTAMEIIRRDNIVVALACHKGCHTDYEKDASNGYVESK